MIDLDATVLKSCMESFGEPVTYLPGAGAPIAANGVFERRHREEKASEDGASLITYRPILGIRASLLPGKPAENEQFMIRGQYWSVARVHDDGEGHYTVFLHGPL